VTLLEVLVATAVGVVVAGLVLGILIQSNRETDLEMRRAKLLSSASELLQEVQAWCERSRDVTEYNDEVYETNRLRLNARSADTAAPGMWEAKTVAEEGGVVEVHSIWTGDGWGNPPDEASGEWRVFGEDPSIQLSLTFRYAWDLDGLAPAWNPARRGRERPRMVEVTVLAQDAMGRVKSIRLTSALGVRSPEGREQ
jgi:hypothetical protein